MPPMCLYVTHNKPCIHLPKVVLEVLVWHLSCFTLTRALALPKLSFVSLRRYNSYEEAKGFLSYRVAHRRRHHFDHRGDCHSELAAFENGSQRILCCWLAALDQHCGSNLRDCVP